MGLTVAAAILGLAMTPLAANITLTQLKLAGLDINGAVNWDVVSVAGGLALVTGVAVGWLVAGVFPSDVVTTALVHGDVRTASPRVRYLQVTLIALELTLAVMLSTGAASVGSALMKLLRDDIGFDRHDLVALNPFDHRSQFADEASERSLTETLRRIAALPGVLQVSAAGDDAVRSIRTPNMPTPLPVGVRLTRWAVSSEFFSTMRIPIRHGRALDRGDRAGADPVIVISQSAAEQLWGAVDPIGRKLVLVPPDSSVGEVWATVVGVAADASFGREPSDAHALVVYRPVDQTSARNLIIYARVSHDAPPSEAELRGVVHSLRGGPIHARDVERYDQFEDQFLSRPQFTAGAMIIFAAFSLFLAFIGIYAIVAQTVASRRRELAIRIAVGATSWHVVRIVTSTVAAGCALGAGFGLACSFAVTRMLGALVEGASLVALTHSWLSVLVIGMCAGVVAVAGYFPVRYAIRTDPVRALWTN